MPRAPRIFIEGGIDHVYNRFTRGEPVFAVDGEAQSFVELMREIKQRDGLVVLAWCVEPLPPGGPLYVGSTVAVHGERATQNDSGIQHLQGMTPTYTENHRMYEPGTFIYADEPTGARVVGRRTGPYSMILRNTGGGSRRPSR